MLTKIRAMMATEIIDGFFVSSPENVRYITGYQENNAYVLLTEKGNYVLTDGRQLELARQCCVGFEVINWQEKANKLKQAINEIVIGDGVKRLGFEAEHLTYKQFTDLYDMVDTEITPVLGLIERHRANKSEEELSRIRKACEINDRVFKRLALKIRPGISEREISALCDYYIRIEGGEVGVNVVLAGNRSSLIMARPSDYTLESGDLLLMNYGATYKGYLTDFTRTVVVGDATEKQKEIYNVVRGAYQAALGAIKAGALAREPFYASEKVIREAGYREYHYEGIGHGVGLFIHEEPFLDKNSKLILEKNNVLTVEPGIYIPGWGGIRIEDVIAITDTGVECLTKTARDLLEIHAS